MYAQCPKCKSVFRVSGAQLSARNGLVRCGQCQDVFNASWNLVDDVPAVVGGIRQAQERSAASRGSPSASTAGGSVAPAAWRPGGEQVELFDSDAEVTGARAERRSKAEASPGPASDANERLLPSSMPFSIVEDDASAAAHADRSTANAEPAGKNAAGPVEDVENVVSTAQQADSVISQEEAGSTDVVDRAAEQPDTPLQVSGPDTGWHDAGAGADNSLEATEQITVGVETGQSDLALEAVAGDGGTRIDTLFEGMDSSSEAATAETPDLETEAVAPGDPSLPAVESPPSLEGEDRVEGEEAEDRAVPSLADLFAAAEEPLGEADESAASTREAAAGTSLRGLFAIPDDDSRRQQRGGTSASGEEADQPAAPAVFKEAGDGDAGDRAARASTLFDSADAEEIVIEAPAMLWDAFRDEAPAEGGGSREGTGDDEDSDIEDTAAMAATPGAAAAAESSGGGPPRPQHSGGERVESPQSATAALGARLRQSREMKLVHLPRRRPLKTAAWIVAAVVLVGVCLWQAKSFYLSNLSQVSALRPYVTAFCDVFSCTVPPRSAFNLIDLVGTSVNTHPETPGALRVSVNLVNRAEFEQAFPPLEITLSDRSGRIVGRRTYLPEEYLTDPASLLVPKVIQEVDIDLAQPSENAVGYEIQLVAR